VSRRTKVLLGIAVLQTAWIISMVLWIGWVETLIAYGIVAVFILYTAAKYLRPCTCDRHRDWYYRPGHPKVGWMLFQAVLFAVLLGLDLWAINVGGALYETILLVWHIRWVWFHEKDRLIRWLEKATGKVKINEHGRLVITHA